MAAKACVLLLALVAAAAAEEWTIPALVEEKEDFPAFTPSLTQPCIGPYCGGQFATHGIDAFQPTLVVPVHHVIHTTAKDKKPVSKSEKDAAKLRAKKRAAKAKLKAEKEKGKALKAEAKIEKKLQQKIQKNVKAEMKVTKQMAQAKASVAKAKAVAKRSAKKAKAAIRRAKRRRNRRRRAKKANKKGKKGKGKKKNAGPGGECGKLLQGCQAQCDKERASRERMLKMKLKSLKKKGKKGKKKGKKGKKLQAVPTCPPGATCILPVGKPKSLADLLSSFRETSVKISGHVGPMQQELIDAFTPEEGSSFLDISEEVDDTILAEIEEVMDELNTHAAQVSCQKGKKCKSNCIATCQKSYLACKQKGNKVNQISIDLGKPAGAAGAPGAATNPAAPQMKNGAVGPDGQPAAVGPDGKPAAVGPDGKPAAVGPDGKPAATGPDGKPKPAPAKKAAAKTRTRSRSKRRSRGSRRSRR